VKPTGEILQCIADSLGDRIFVNELDIDDLVQMTSGEGLALGTMTIRYEAETATVSVLDNTTGYVATARVPQ
jgi:hypothetical protein